MPRQGVPGLTVFYSCDHIPSFVPYLVYFSMQSWKVFYTISKVPLYLIFWFQKRWIFKINYVCSGLIFKSKSCKVNWNSRNNFLFQLGSKKSTNDNLAILQMVNWLLEKIANLEIIGSIGDSIRETPTFPHKAQLD